jgi:hypothetical protein
LSRLTSATSSSVDFGEPPDDVEEGKPMPHHSPDQPFGC